VKLKSMQSRIFFHAFIIGIVTLALSLVVVYLVTDITGGELLKVFVVIFLALLAISTTLSVALSMTFRRCLSPLQDFSERLAGRDLTGGLEVVSDDVIGDFARNLQDAVSSLRSLIDKIQDTAFQMNSTTEQLAATSQEVN